LRIRRRDEAQLRQRVSVLFAFDDIHLGARRRGVELGQPIWDLAALGFAVDPFAAIPTALRKLFFAFGVDELAHHEVRRSIGEPIDVAGELRAPIALRLRLEVGQSDLAADIVTAFDRAVAGERM
jgi:hypothetical protein